MSGSAAPSTEFRVELERRFAYRFTCRPGLLDDYGAHLARTVGRPRIVVVTDERVLELHGAALARSLSRAGHRYDVLAVPPGETSKSLENFERLLGDFTALHVDRRSLVVCFGGGVISDLGGFAASAYMRGIAYANLPTTLIGQLDASIGGKVAVNTAEAKNLIGAFHHPIDVACDPRLLATLDARELRSGAAEGIKVALIDGVELFERIEREAARLDARDPAFLAALVAEAARIKVRLLAPDPFEHDLRRPLNLGHTLGHPLETAYAYRGLRHGEAVAVGIGIATCLARRRSLLAPADAERILALLARADLLWTGEELPVDLLLDGLEHVRRIRAGKLHFVLPTAIGGVQIVDELAPRELRTGIEEYAIEASRRSVCRATAS